MGDKIEDLSVIASTICFKDWTMAPSGIEFVSDRNSPWFSSLFVAGLRGEHIRRYQFENGIPKREEIFFVAGKDSSSKKDNIISRRIRDVEYFNNALYVLGDHFGLLKLTPR
jgi:glucose/arabinose dehydrogenase